MGRLAVKAIPQQPMNNTFRLFLGNRMLPMTAIFLLSAALIQADYAADGQGLRPVLSGSLPNAGLYIQTQHTWINTATPEKPYQIEAEFSLPACDAIAVARLILTVWGGTANYTCEMDVRINDLELPGAHPLVFGTTDDANPSFSPEMPNAYGTGFGVWLVTLPVPSVLLHRDGSLNRVQITINTPDSFDGRIQHVTLVAVHQSASLNNHFQFVIAEGSGDIFRVPTDTRVSTRTAQLAVDPTDALAAQFTALYTYGVADQNDQLYFNQGQLGDDNVARYDKTVTGLDFGPDVVSFDILDLLAPVNTVTFTIAEGLVPDVREFSLRPQLALLEVVSPATAVSPTLDIALHTAIRWPVTSEDWILEFRADTESDEWLTVPVPPEVLDGHNTVLLPPTAPREFYRLRLPQ
jgi:hypothetical protein